MSDSEVIVPSGSGNKHKRTVTLVPKTPLAHQLNGKGTEEKTDDIRIAENLNFNDLMLSEKILKGLSASGFKHPSPIQVEAIPLGRFGLDLVVQAKSGTGKTCVFVVVALETVLLENLHPQVLIVCPTREIAEQTQSAIKAIGSAMPELKSRCFIGGKELKVDQNSCKKCHIAVGTPGRLCQLVDEKHLKLDHIRLMILDEADQLMNQSYQQNINWLYQQAPEKKQLIVLSATYPAELKELLTRYMRTPQIVSLNATDVQLLGLKQYYQVIKRSSEGIMDTKLSALHEILAQLSYTQCLVFCNTQIKAQQVTDYLKSVDIPSDLTSGGLDQKIRSSVMEKFKNFEIRVLVSTDLLARGIDSAHTNLVVNFDIPDTPETYFHRIGRAGRFGGYGASLTIVVAGDNDIFFYSLAVSHHFHVKQLPIPMPSELVNDEVLYQTLPNVDFKSLLNDLTIKSTKTAVTSDDNAGVDAHRKILTPKRRNRQESVPEVTSFVHSYTRDQMMQIRDATEVDGAIGNPILSEEKPEDLLKKDISSPIRTYTREQMLGIKDGTYLDIPASNINNSAEVKTENNKSSSKNKETAYKYTREEMLNIRGNNVAQRGDPVVGSNLNRVEPIVPSREATVLHMYTREDLFKIKAEVSRDNGISSHYCHTEKVKILQTLQLNSSEPVSVKMYSREQMMKLREVVNGDSKKVATEAVEVVCGGKPLELQPNHEVKLKIPEDRELQSRFSPTPAYPPLNYKSNVESSESPHSDSVSIETRVKQKAIHQAEKTKSNENPVEVEANHSTIEKDNQVALQPSVVGPVERTVEEKPAVTLKKDTCRKPYNFYGDDVAAEIEAHLVSHMIPGSAGNEGRLIKKKEKNKKKQEKKNKLMPKSSEDVQAEQPKKEDLPPPKLELENGQMIAETSDNGIVKMPPPFLFLHEKLPILSYEAQCARIVATKNLTPESGTYQNEADASRHAVYVRFSERNAKRMAMLYAQLEQEFRDELWLRSRCVNDSHFEAVWKLLKSGSNETQSIGSQTDEAESTHSSTQTDEPAVLSTPTGCDIGVSCHPSVKSASVDCYICTESIPFFEVGSDNELTKDSPNSLIQRSRSCTAQSSAASVDSRVSSNQTRKRQKQRKGEDKTIQQAYTHTGVSEPFNSDFPSKSQSCTGSGSQIDSSAAGCPPFFSEGNVQSVSGGTVSYNGGKAQSFGFPSLDKDINVPYGVTSQGTDQIRTDTNRSADVKRLVLLHQSAERGSQDQMGRQTPQSTAHPHSTSHDSLPEVLMYGEALQQWYRDCFLPWSQGPLQDMSKYVREMTEICKQSPQGSGTH